MNYYLDGHDFKYAAEEMLFSVLSTEPWEKLEEYPTDLSNALVSSLQEQDGKIIIQAQTEKDGNMLSSQREILLDGFDEIARKRAISQAVKITIYEATVQRRQSPPAWGALTGVRPAKLARMLLEQGHTREQVPDILRQEYRVSPERIDLAMPCMDAALAVQKVLTPRSISLYIGIPFCPSRCSYCSFVSNSIEKAEKWIEPYLEVLLQEITETAKALRDADLKIFSIYIGGGTPTTLTAQQLIKLLTHVREQLDLSELREFTVEAGRPDTIIEEKLKALKAGGVDRISINPQSLNPAVLAGIGRRHSVEQFYESCALAQKQGFSSINMDLIAGLDGDTADSFRHSVAELIRLSPENITIHTLAAKKGADRADRVANAAKQSLVAEMLDFANVALRQAGYQPYYLYRQKFMVGGFENVGWCKPGTECLYNICMMEEIQDIVSLGAGGVTKFCRSGNHQIQRIANPKYPYEYVAQKERVWEAKRQMGKA